MTTREEAIAACMTLPFVYEDYPFDEGEWTAMRHLENKKIFALIFERQGHIWINVKAEPRWGELWRNAYPAVIPGYHMNKKHWLSIILDGSMDDADILRLIQDSYSLTAPKRKRTQTERYL